MYNKLNPLTTSFMAEVTAISKAIDIAVDSGRPVINICAVSKNLLDALSPCEKDSI